MTVVVSLTACVMYNSLSHTEAGTLLSTYSCLTVCLVVACFHATNFCILKDHHKQ